MKGEEKEGGEGDRLRKEDTSNELEKYKRGRERGGKGGEERVLYWVKQLHSHSPTWSFSIEGEGYESRSRGSFIIREKERERVWEKGER